MLFCKRNLFILAISTGPLLALGAQGGAEKSSSLNPARQLSVSNQPLHRIIKLVANEAGWNFVAPDAELFPEIVTASYMGSPEETMHYLGTNFGFTWTRNNGVVMFLREGKGKKMDRQEAIPVTYQLRNDVGAELEAALSRILSSPAPREQTQAPKSSVCYGRFAFQPDTNSLRIFADRAAQSVMASALREYAATHPQVSVRTETAAETAQPPSVIWGSFSFFPENNKLVILADKEAQSALSAAMKAYAEAPFPVSVSCSEAPSAKVSAPQAPRFALSKGANQLVVVATPDEHKAVAQAVAAFDRPKQQIAIQVDFLAFGHANAEEIGFTGLSPAGTIFALPKSGTEATSAELVRTASTSSLIPAGDYRRALAFMESGGWCKRLRTLTLTGSEAATLEQTTGDTIPLLASGESTAALVDLKLRLTPRVRLREATETRPSIAILSSVIAAGAPSPLETTELVVPAGQTAKVFDRPVSYETDDGRRFVRVLAYLTPVVQDGAYQRITTQGAPSERAEGEKDFLTITPVTPGNGPVTFYHP